LFIPIYDKISELQHQDIFSWYDVDEYACYDVKALAYAKGVAACSGGDTIPAGSTQWYEDGCQGHRT
jgi:hypothetical protein